MPRSTTPSIMPRMVMAVSGRRMRFGGSVGAGRPPSFKMILGLTRSPPLAIAAQARASWIEVVLISWPMAMDASEVFPQRSSFRNRPPDSAGSGIPVEEPKPKRRTYSYIFCAPTLEPIWIAPILLDFSSTCRISSVP